ncbi:hypothetical protein EA462_07425 [Natrarchaeobius halalkaliphilus]|uniref:Uncharacterized protein n=1 Tax=Natrarchaeobius halalkaliphilus TaxID=1679091 RepID=A0A3N6M218_9EURY|nr:hypothetical protein [Natrarchaeobius halalkaliphilus]RQG89840.1 hypothetical protein EA462_07425 [Natrarchaeobius halalkaliphilus]
MDDRGVTELIGYSIIFGLVLLSFSMLFLVGTTTVSDSRDRTQINNAEAAFEILASNMDDHANDREVGRATEIRVTDAALYFGPSESVNVTVSPDGSEDNVTVYDRSTEPIVYETQQGERVVYSNGAVFREDTDTSRMVREPQTKIDENRTVLPQVRFTSTEGGISVGGSQTVLVRTERLTSRFEQNTTSDGYELEIEITTDERRGDAWRSYFGSYELLECAESDVVEQPDGNVAVTCETTGQMTSEIYVPETRLQGEIN